MTAGEPSVIRLLRHRHSIPRQRAFPDEKAIEEMHSASRFTVANGNVERSLMFVYWGTRGSLPLLTRELAHESCRRSDVSCTFSISSSNELFSEFGFLGDKLLSVDVFPARASFLLSQGWIRALRCLTERLIADKTRAVISLMPHLLSPLIAPAIRRLGVKHVAVVHDADAHPGDHHALVNWWLLREGMSADTVVTLSNSVAKRLVAARNVPEEKIRVLFHPDLDYVRGPAVNTGPGDPLRILFFGRILEYKGLPLFIEAAEILKRSGVPLKVGVFGYGDIGPADRRRLGLLRAEVENRWIDNAEIGSIFSRYDLVVAAHTEASQSGVVSAALGSGLPVVATPVGGLLEQVLPNLTGIIADAATGPGLAAAIGRIAENRALLAEMRQAIARTSGDRSVRKFFDQICEIALS